MNITRKRKLRSPTVNVKVSCEWGPGAFLPHVCPCERAHFFSGNTELFHSRIGSSYRQKGKSLSRIPASPSSLPSLSCQEMLQTPNTFILGHAAGKSHAWIPALLLKEGPFLLCKASRNARELKADLLKSAYRAGGLGGWEGATFSKKDGRFSHNPLHCFWDTPLEGRWSHPSAGPAANPFGVHLNGKSGLGQPQTHPVSKGGA